MATDILPNQDRDSHWKQASKADPQTDGAYHALPCGGLLILHPERGRICQKCDQRPEMHAVVKPKFAKPSGLRDESFGGDSLLGMTARLGFACAVLAIVSVACDGNPTKPSAVTAGCASGAGYPSSINVALTNAPCADSPVQHKPGATSDGTQSQDAAVLIDRARQVMNLYPKAMVLADGTQSFGPHGCVDASTIGDVALWYLTNIPRGASIQKAYHYHPDVNCEPTIANQRTENDHLRYSWIGDTMLLVEYDLLAYPCKGRQQPDVDVNGVTAIGVTFYRNQHASPSCDPPPLIDACPEGLDVGRTRSSKGELNGFANITAYVRAGYSVDVSLASWRIVPGTPIGKFCTWKDQDRYGYQLEHIVGPAEFPLSVPLLGARQYDFVCGPAPLHYGESNADDYNSRILTWKGCDGPSAENCTWVADSLLAQ